MPRGCRPTLDVVVDGDGDGFSANWLTPASSQHATEAVAGEAVCFVDPVSAAAEHAHAQRRREASRKNQSRCARVLMQPARRGGAYLSVAGLRLGDMRK